MSTIDSTDPLVARIERIKREELNCFVPFDNQTMDHIGALVGAYLDLSMENYKYRYNEDMSYRLCMRQCLRS